MPRESKHRTPGKIAIDMTPMIDIVFQLLTFFIMTLKIASAEGDFQIHMPVASPGVASTTSPPIHVYLRSDQAGNCSRVVLGETEFTGVDRWDRVHQQLAGMVGEGNLAQEAEVQLHCDPQLRYEHTMAAITAISGRIDPASGNIVRLIEKINFAPPR
jgi:biopolymer transport protein ExbD